MGCRSRTVENNVFANNMFRYLIEIQDIMKTYIETISNVFYITEISPGSRVKAIENGDVRPELQASMGEIAPNEAQTSRDEDFLTMQTGQSFICRHKRRSISYPSV
jgi:hypothetical protein